MKKYYKFLFIALFGLFIFLPKDTFAQQISYQQPTFYWQAYPVNNPNDLQSATFKAADDRLYKWGTASDDFNLLRNGLLIDYTSLGSSNYQVKARFYLSVPYFPLTNSGTASCSLWGSDIYNSSCSIDNISYDYNSGVSGNIDYYYDVTYNFSTYGSTYIELWINYNDLILSPSITYFAYNLMSFEGQLDNSAIIVDQNTTIINQNQQTNQKLDEAEETRKGIWETIKELPGKFLDMLVGLFIPDDMSFLDNFRESLEDKLGFIAEVPLAILDFLFNLVNAGWDSFNSITLPSIEMFGVSFWDSQEISLQPAIDIFSPYKYITDVICVILCVNTLRKWYENFASGGGN